jgi:hypothetical protein
MRSWVRESGPGGFIFTILHSIKELVMMNCGMCGLEVRNRDELRPVYGEVSACRFCQALLRAGKNPRAQAVHDGFRIFEYFADKYGWPSGWDRDGTLLWNDWTEAKIKLAEVLPKGQLTGGDITVLSLSMGCGDTPCFPGYDARSRVGSDILDKEATYELAHSLVELYTPRKSKIKLFPSLAETMLTLA